MPAKDPVSIAAMNNNIGKYVNQFCMFFRFVFFFFQSSCKARLEQRHFVCF